MLATIIKFLVIGIGIFITGRLLWYVFLRYKDSRVNKAALIALDNQIKKLIKKLDKVAAKTAEKLAQEKQDKKNLDKLVNLYEEKLEKNDN